MAEKDSAKDAALERIRNHASNEPPAEAVAAYQAGNEKASAKAEDGKVTELQSRLETIETQLKNTSLGTKTAPDGADPVQRGPQRLTRNMADPGVDAGKWLRKAIMDPRAELTSTGDGSGLIPDRVSQQIWYALLGRLSMVEAGAEMIRLPDGSYRVPSESTASTAHWLAENAEITDAGTVFGDSGLEPHNIKALLSASNESLQDSPEWSERAIFRSLTDALSRAMNSAFLSGSGSGSEPEGVFTNADVTETDLSGTDLSIDHIISAYYDVLSKGGRSDSMIMLLSPAAAKWMEQIRESSGSGNYLASSAGPFFRGMRWVVDQNAPYTSGSPDTADVIITDAEQALQIVEFGSMRMSVDASAGFSRNQTMFRVVSRLDIGVRYPELVHKLSSAQVSSA